MALINEKNYTVIETNAVNAVKTGEMVSQYELTGDAKTNGVQQGMVLSVDHINRTVSLPADADAVVYLHASEEQLYEYEAREMFILKDPKLPRLYKFKVGDIFETDAVELNSQTLEAGAVGVPAATGFITLQASAAGTESFVFEVVEPVTLPNGKPGAKLVVTKANY